MAAVLIIDDEPGERRTLAALLEGEKHRVFTAADAVTGLEILDREAVNLIFLNALLPRMGGMDALKRIRGEWPDTETVMISGHASVEMAVRAVKLGAFDFLEKPLSPDKALAVCRNALAVQRLREENLRCKNSALFASSEIIGTSAAINAVRESVRQAAASDARILITGENGSGKDVAARAIHAGSSRAGRAFVEINCAAIPDSLIESELFGHEKGAFTDAVSARKGRFEMADGGTLFLDEVGDMSLQAQSKVLRAIQEQKIERLGGEKTIETNVRIIAATNKNLEKECAEGRFREDLFFRLNVIPLKIPPLRERAEDVPLLLCHFLAALGFENSEIDDDALALLVSYEWPGNVRELRNLAERIAVMHRGERLGKAAVLGLLQTRTGSADRKTDGKSGKQGGAELPGEVMDLDFSGAKEWFERHYLELQLSRNDGIIARTAETIGVNPGNLRAKLRKYGLCRNHKESK
ncbi:MAG TPA: Fis family transcriptional regulator [Treponema sp.]|nr:Fis family transcriptional regulator [Treponema sp.]